MDQAEHYRANNFAALSRGCYTPSMRGTPAAYTAWQAMHMTGWARGPGDPLEELADKGKLKLFEGY